MAVFFTQRAHGTHNYNQTVPHPSHPYRDSADLTQLFLNNWLTGITLQDFVDCLGLVGYCPLKDYWNYFLTPVAGSSI